MPANNACVRGSPMLPLGGNICTIGTNLIANQPMVPLVKKLVQMVKMVIPLVPMVQMLPTNGTIGGTPNTRTADKLQRGEIYQHEKVT